MNHIHNGTETSKAAAHSLTNTKAQHRQILKLIIDAGSEGHTRQELEKITGIKCYAVCPRVWKMIKDGIVYEPGAVRMTDSGRAAKVVVAVLS